MAIVGNDVGSSNYLVHVRTYGKFTRKWRKKSEATPNSWFVCIYACVVTAIVYSDYISKDTSAFNPVQMAACYSSNNNPIQCNICNVYEFTCGDENKDKKLETVFVPEQ